MYPAIYEHGPGFSDHPQVDTGLGFTCDEGVLQLVLAFTEAGFPTLCSCEANGPWYIKRKFVRFTHDKVSELLELALYIKKNLSSCFRQHLVIDNTCGGADPFVDLDIIPDLEAQLLLVIRSYSRR